MLWPTCITLHLAVLNCICHVADQSSTTSSITLDQISVDSAVYSASNLGVVSKLKNNGKLYAYSSQLHAKDFLKVHTNFDCPNFFRVKMTHCSDAQWLLSPFPASGIEIGRRFCPHVRGLMPMLSGLFLSFYSPTIPFSAYSPALPYVLFPFPSTLPPLFLIAQ